MAKMDTMEDGIAELRKRQERRLREIELEHTGNSSEARIKLAIIHRALNDFRRSR